MAGLSRDGHGWLNIADRSTALSAVTRHANDEERQCDLTPDQSLVFRVSDATVCYSMNRAIRHKNSLEDIVTSIVTPIVNVYTVGIPHNTEIM